MNIKLIFKLHCLEFDFKCISDERNKNLINLLVSNEIPFKITNCEILNFENYDLLEGHSDPIKKIVSSEKIIRKCLNKFLINKDGKINISASLDNKFSGNVIEHSSLEMTLDDYFNYKGEVNLYLSQINILNAEDNIFNTSANILNTPNILNYSHLENILNTQFTRVNIWHSFKNTLSKFHFDSYDNLLYVIKGKKKIFLTANNSRFIKPSKIGENSGNQSERVIYKKSNQHIDLLKDKLLLLMDQVLKFNNEEINLSYSKESVLNFLKNYKELFDKIVKFFILNIELKENEMLYIPEGWWHQVNTEGDDNLAFNFWWEKTNKLIENGKEMFLIKQTLSSLVDKKINRIYKKNRNKRKFRKFKLKYLQKLVNNGKSLELKNLIFENNFEGFIIIYSEFEKSKTNFNSDLKTFFQNFWKILEDFECVNLFFDRINEMKNKIMTDIIDDIKKNI